MPNRKPEYWAHSPEPDEGVPPHLLKVHLLSVAEHAREFGSYFKIPGSATLLFTSGILHDLGKYKLDFQRGRLGHDPDSGSGNWPKKHGVDHSSLGALTVYRPHEDNPEGSMLDALARAIAGHHAGLVDAAAFRGRLEAARSEPNWRSPIQKAVEDFPDLTKHANALSEVTLQLSGTSFDVLTRMLLSCLVDADRTDTEAHLNSARSAVRSRKVQPLEVLDRRFTARMAGLMSDATQLNRLRREMYEKVVARASLEPGFFRLTMPTGSGKTLASLSFALKHARHHGLRRVIYGIPYTSIIDQTARVFREFLNDEGEENILEHHSAVEPTNSSSEELQLWASLLSENWDTPLVVTTTVQIFESLFANKTGRLRKIHNITGSVIVLDEVQTLPTTLLGPILDLLNELVERYHVSVVLCTATQPTFEAIDGFSSTGVAKSRDLLPNSPEYFNALQRVDYTVDISTPTPWNSIAEQMLLNPSVLTIVNLRRHARELYDLVRAEDPLALHLSTYMYPIHRKEVLDHISQRLNNGDSCRVVSTQMIECGVDVDFPTVFRAIGPLDALVQAAGRCNREGRLVDASGSIRRGHVWVFRPEGRNTPRGDYMVKTAAAEELLLGNNNLDDPGVFEQYYRRVFNDVDTQNLELQIARSKQQFATVAENFKFVDSDTVPVVITARHFNGQRTQLSEPLDLLNLIESADGEPGAWIWRRLQNYCVGVFRNDLARHAPRLRRVVVKSSEDAELYEWTGVYDEHVGLIEEGDPGRYWA